MTKPPEITTRLASRLKLERAAKGLSLDALAALSGVSKSMISQIERGESSPTVASLWNLTRALNVDFLTLLDQSAEPAHQVLRSDATPSIRDRASGCVIRILSAPEDVGATEIYDIRFEPGASLESAAHGRDCVEHLTVLGGTLEVSSDGEQTQAGVGDTVRYSAGVDHSIRAKGKDPARALLIVKNA